MLFEWLLAFVLLCSAVPAVLFCVNLRLYREPPAAAEPQGRVAVLIPARNEEANIAACLRCVLKSRNAELEVLVLDDHSSDCTAALVGKLAEADGRVRLLRGAPLPTGWNGKQFACWQLAQAAEAPRMLFLDADVRIEPEAISRMLAFLQHSSAELVSGFPRQRTVTTLEWLLLPFIHFILLGFLPLWQMRLSISPSLAAGCGQFLLVERDAYLASGGHAAIRETRHDGLLLPRTLRSHGYRTDLADLTELAHVRMYDSAGAVWTGLTKNATEGLAAPARIVPFTLLLLLGQVAPALYFVGVLLAATLWDGLRTPLGMEARVTPSGVALAQLLLMLAALVASYLPRVLAARRFRQSWKSAMLHPVGVLLLLLLQWHALLRQLLGKPVRWRSRTVM